MNSIWNKNLALLERRFPQLYALLEADLRAVAPVSLPSDGDNLDFPCGWKLKKARTGAWTAEPGLHSRYDPQKEGWRLAESVLQEMEAAEKNVPVFMGFGLGYGLVSLAEQVGGRRSNGADSGAKGFSGLVLVEPDAACFAAALWSLDFEPVFALEPCALLVGASHQSVLGVLESLGLENCHFVWNKAHTDHNQPYFDGLRTLIQRNQDKDAINSRTLDKFGRLWLRNSCRNLEKLAACDGVSRYENLGWNLDACVVGAGPSLDEVLPHLARIKERCLLIAVDTALRACLRAGVEPDFVVLADPQYWNARHLAGLSTSNTVLVTEVAAYPSVFRFPCEEVVLCSSLYPIGKFFADRGLDKGELGAGGSVATSAWGLARLCGCRRIFLAGVDLSFPGKRTHAHGSTFEEKSHQNSTRLSPSEQSQVAALYSAGTKIKKSYGGDEVITDQRMELYAWWFESKVASHPESRTFSLTHSSLAIPGIQPFSLEELLRQPSRLAERQEFFANEKKAHEKFVSHKDAVAANFRTLSVDLQEGLLQMYKAARKGERLCQEALAQVEGRGFEQSYNRIIGHLAAIDQGIRTSPYHQAASLAFPSQQKLDELYEKSSLSPNLCRATLEKSRILYKKIMEGLSLYKEFL